MTSLSTPASATYSDQDTNCLPPVRGASGHEWYGFSGLPADLKDAIDKEDQTWLRVAEAALGLTKLRKKILIVYVINGDVGPTQLLSMLECLRTPGVCWLIIQLRVLKLGSSHMASSTSMGTARTLRIYIYDDDESGQHC